MIQTIFVPLIPVEHNHVRTIAEAHRNNARKAAEASLNELIESGWSFLRIERVEAESGLYVAYTMYKRNQDVAPNPFGLSASKSPTVPKPGRGKSPNRRSI